MDLLTLPNKDWTEALLSNIYGEPMLFGVLFSIEEGSFILLTFVVIDLPPELEVNVKLVPVSHLPKTTEVNVSSGNKSDGIPIVGAHIVIIVCDDSVEPDPFANLRDLFVWRINKRDFVAIKNTTIDKLFFKMLLLQDPAVVNKISSF
jgi:hypothetical protein